MTTSPLPEQIELHRDRMWRRDEDLRIESAVDAERFIEDVGFANTPIGAIGARLAIFAIPNSLWCLFGVVSWFDFSAATKATNHEITQTDAKSCLFLIAF
jgi:hypothetical protein